MERWREVWRKGVAPMIDVDGLEALAEALRSDDPRLIQTRSTNPSAIPEWINAPCLGACALAFPGLSDGAMVAEVDEKFLAVLRGCDELLDHRGGSAAFIHWFDQTPRNEMRAALLVEVEAALAERRAA